jgi:hypothetical protein
LEICDTPDKNIVHRVVVTVHPIDTSIHPSYPPGWRWGITVGGKPINDLDYCVGAGHAPTERDAALRGEETGAAIVLAMRKFGIVAQYGFQRMTWDPIPASADDRPLLRFQGE